MHRARGKPQGAKRLRQRAEAGGVQQQAAIPDGNVDLATRQLGREPPQRRAVRDDGRGPGALGRNVGRGQARTDRRPGGTAGQRSLCSSPPDLLRSVEGIRGVPDSNNQIVLGSHHAPDAVRAAASPFDGRKLLAGALDVTAKVIGARDTRDGGAVWA